MSKASAFKKTITFLLVIVIILLAFSALSLGSRMNEAQKKVDDLRNQVAQYENMTRPPANVKFTDISVRPWYVDEYYGPPPYYKNINVTFQNVGTKTIGGITLEFEVEGNTSDIYFEIYVHPNLLGLLHVQESKSLIVRIVTDVYNRALLSRCNLIITMMLDNLILDEQTVMLGS